MAIQALNGYEIGSANPIDTRFVMTKAEMAAIKDSRMPDVYFTSCKDDGCFYLYIKTNEALETTGKFRKFEGGSGGSSSQVETLPTASAEELGKIYQYIGATTDTLNNAYFYKCVFEDEEYSWVNVKVQAGNGGDCVVEVETLPTEKDKVIYNVADKKVYSKDRELERHGVEITESNLNALVESGDVDNDISYYVKDGEPDTSIIDDTISTSSSTYSSQKVNQIVEDYLKLDTYTTEKGAAGGIATLDANGRLLTSQLPTSAMSIVGYFDASAEHSLPPVDDYENGNQLVITSDGYYEQSTSFTLVQGATLTSLEVAKAMALVNAGYVFTLYKNGSSLGTVKEFKSDKVILTDDTEIALPYATDLSATSVPSIVQVPVREGDIVMMIDKHWIHLSNNNSVDSVNGKTGAVTIAEYNPTNKPQLEKIGENAEGNLTYNGEEIKGGSDEFVGTKAEWEALSTEEKAKFDGKKLNFTDSEGENLIDDTAPANNKVYSSSKVESLLTGIGTIYRANWTKTEASEVNEDLTEELTLGKGNYILIAQIPFVNAVDGVRLYSIYNKTDFIYESFAMSQYSYASFLAVISIDSTKTYAIKDSGGAVSTGYDARYIDRGYLKAIKLDA